LANPLVTLEGLVAKLDTELNIMEIAEPIARKLMFKTFSLEKFGKEIYGGVLDYSYLIKDFPSVFHNFLKKLEDDEFTLQLKMNGSEQVEKNTEKRINRIVFSLILLAVSIVTAGLIISLGFSTQAGLEIFESYITALKVSLFTFVAFFIGLVFSVLRSK